MTSNKICNAISTDHSAIILSICIIPDDVKGPSHWRFNTALLEDEDYVNNIKTNLIQWKAEYEGDNAKSRWEYMKYKIRQYSIQYSKKKAKLFKKELKELEQWVTVYENDLESRNNNKEMEKKYINAKSELDK